MCVPRALRHSVRVIVALVALWASVGTADAQSQAPTTFTDREDAAPDPSASMAMASRDPEGRLVIRAMRLREKLIIDGKLDESVYAQVQPVSGFLQAEPHYNEPATEQTQLWVFFDDRALYIGIRCFDSQMDKWSNLDKRRDSPGYTESVSVAFDTFYDKRNGFIFGVNPVGGINDSAVSNERDSNRDWNTIRAWRSDLGHQRSANREVEK
ncbi:MAG: hypothetical protein PVSMB1_01060 [Gemmatimonadaceae bacterium]